MCYSAGASCMLMISCKLGATHSVYVRVEQYDVIPYVVFTMLHINFINILANGLFHVGFLWFIFVGEVDILTNIQLSAYSK